uniref:Uncharacterized protein n=1 Tax=Anguilla anguilla TaxID=7936 RepID=A0A0E9WVB4_ANGAN
MTSGVRCLLFKCSSCAAKFNFVTYILTFRTECLLSNHIFCVLFFHSFLSLLGCLILLLVCILAAFTRMYLKCMGSEGEIN